MHAWARAGHHLRIRGRERYDRRHHGTTTRLAYYTLRVLRSNSTARLSACGWQVRGCSASAGGGMRVSALRANSTLTLRSMVFENNRAESGGACATPAMPARLVALIRHCASFRSPRAVAGALYIISGEVRINTTLFLRASAEVGEQALSGMVGTPPTVLCAAVGAGPGRDAWVETMMR